MAEIPTAIAAFLSAPTVIKQYVIDPLKVPFKYLCCYKSIFDNLNDKVRRLDIAKNILEPRIDAARQNSEIIRADVKNWLERVGEIKKESDSISGDILKVQQGCVNRSCPNLKLRYSVSRKAKKMAKDIVDLLDEGDFRTVAHSAPLPRIEIESDPSDRDFESRKTTEEEIMDALRDEGVYLIGICGMGGVGKTSMVKKIGKMAKEKDLFDEVAMAGIGRQPDTKRIQNEIAACLGLRLEENETVKSSANRICTRLKGETRILIIIDDIWKKMDLKELGIPSQSNHKGCKIILASRNDRVCKEIEAMLCHVGTETEATGLNKTRIFPLKCLDGEEAWSLFRAKAGSCVVDSDLHQIAKDVAKECKGLPLALAIVGDALRGKSRPSWSDALVQLRKATPSYIPQVLDYVYQPLEQSYDSLDTDDDRYLFLLCCLFPEDSRISVEDLLYYGFGLRIFSTVRTLRQARDRVDAVVHNLESHYMLMDAGRDEGIKYVKMHDVIRDMAINFASPRRQGQHVFMISHDTGLNNWQREDSYENYTHISLTLNEVVQLPESIKCPVLKMLRIKSQRHRQVPPTFFELMRDLNVLDIGNIMSLPSSLQFLKNLRILRLHGSEMDTVSMIAHLVNLEILDLRNSKLEVLPKEIGRLENLKSLNLHRCNRLREIAPGVISSLKRLEELLMLYSFRNWASEDKGKERRNASLEEVASLKDLTALQLHIPDPKVLPKDKPHWRELEGFAVRIEALNETNPLVHTLTRNANCLELKLGGMDASDELIKSIQEGNQNLKRLRLDGCHKMEYLANRSSNSIVFPMLSYLFLSKCRGLEGICQGPPLTSSFAALEHIMLVDLCKLKYLWDQKLCLPNLREVFILNCSSLQYVFLQSTSESLLQLQTLVIERCIALEEIFKAESGGSRDVVSPIKFPNLTKLRLQELPRFNSFCKAVDGNESSNNSDGQYLFHQKVAFTSLVELKLCKLSTVTKIFSCQIPFASFSQLEQLEVIDCSNLEEVVGKEDEEELHAAAKKPLFPKLKNLVLSKLPSLKTFCHIKNDIELPQLESIIIMDCHEMKIFSLGSLSLPQLTYVFGLSDPDLATQILFKKKTQREQIRLSHQQAQREIHQKTPKHEIYCKSFMLSARDLSIQESPNNHWELCSAKDSRDLSIWESQSDCWKLCLAKDSSDNFLVVARLLSCCGLEIKGSFEMVKLRPETLYEVVLEIKLEESHFQCRRPLHLIVGQSEGIKMVLPEDLEQQPRGEWIEILAGEFTTGPSPTGSLEFCLYDDSIGGLLIKGVTIRSKARGIHEEEKLEIETGEVDNYEQQETRIDVEVGAEEEGNMI